MKLGNKGGDSTITGLNFEKKTDLKDLLSEIPGYTFQQSKGRAGVDVLFNDKLVARCFKKNNFYKFLEENNIDWKKIISKRLIPDDSILIIVRETLFIIEVKYQQVAGSVDEKLQT